MEIKNFIDHFEYALDGLESGTIDGATKFKDLKEWDSLAILTLTDKIDIEYGILLRKSEIEAFETIEQLFDFIQSKL